MVQYYIGIDIGSTCAKTIVLNCNKEISYRFVQPTGWSSIDTAEAIRARLGELGIHAENAAFVATGYGRVSVPYAGKCVTEISCHGKGACYIHHQSDLMVIDVGGQDTKIITVKSNAVRDFIMNDKCSAGTGRFLEVMANILGVRIDEMSRLAEKGGNISISSLCTVFAESEVTGLIGRGEKKENIAFAVFDSVVKKVAAQAARLGAADSAICLTGGLCDCEYFRIALSKELGRQIVAGKDGRYAGAIGAALYAFSLQED